MFVIKIIVKVFTLILTTQLISSDCSTIVYKSSSKERSEQSSSDSGSLSELSGEDKVIFDGGGTATATSNAGRTHRRNKNDGIRARSFDDFTSPYTNKATNDNDYKFNVRCPRPEDIHPCTCQEFNKGMESEYQEMEESFEQDGLDDALLEQATASITATNETVIIEDKITFHTGNKRKTRSQPTQPHPDTIETLVFCKYISHEQVLMDALKGFNGHRVDHFVIDSCILPGFPNRLFTNIHILWMQILNTTIHFEEQFFQCAKDCL